MSLDDIGIKHQTDKASTHHGYLPIYEQLFRGFPEDGRILEIGIQFGNSLRTWKDYFEVHTTVKGIDCTDNGVKDCDVMIGDAYSHEVVGNLPHEWDIIIDDGSHFPADQAFFVRHYHKLLSSDGLLIVEDVPSPDVIPLLGANLPQDFAWMMIDCRPQSPLPDSILFVAWRKS